MHHRACAAGGRDRARPAVTGEHAIDQGRGEEYGGAARVVAVVRRFGVRLPAWCCDDGAMGSPQTLSEDDRRTVAAWAADCAERVLWVFEAEAPEDSRPRDAIVRTRAFARGELDV